MHVLIVEDDPALYETIARGLERQHHLRQGRGWAESLALLRTEAFDCIVVNVSEHSVRRGLKFLSFLQVFGEGLPVIAYGAAELSDKAQARGANIFLATPFTPTQLNTVLLQLQAARGSRSASMEERPKAAAPSVARQGGDELQWRINE